MNLGSRGKYITEQCTREVRRGCLDFVVSTPVQVIACSRLEFDRNIATHDNMTGASHASDPANVEEPAAVQRDCTLMPSEKNPGREEMSLLEAAALSANESARVVQRPCKVVTRRNVDQVA
jgi:hypothetical protein